MAWSFISSSAIPPVSRKSDGDSAGVDHGSVAAGVRARTGRGFSLGDRVRERLEPPLGADLSRVRIHADAAADDLARSVHAHAFTSGRDIFFRAGLYDPESRAGRRLLTHELVHVAQQTTTPPSGRGDPLTISTPQEASEREAERIAGAVSHEKVR